MRVGYAQDVITPSLSKAVYLAGFGQNRRAETIHDDLYVRAIAIDDSSHTLVLCSLDLIGFFRHQVYEVIRSVQTSEVLKTLQVSSLDILLSSIHPHHGPDTMGLWGPDDKTSGIDPVYLARLKDKIVATILAALGNLQPLGGIKTASIHVPGVAKNARNPEIVDDELVLLQFLDAHHQPLITAMNFPCHPEVLWEHNPHITADYPGFLRREAERLSGAPCIFFSADLGGMMTPDVKDHSFEEAEIIGKKLAEEGHKALESASVLCDPITISFKKKEFDVKLSNILFKFAIRRGLFPNIRDKKGRVHTEANLIKIGPVWFATIPGELLPKLGMALKADLRAAGADIAGVIGLANDELGYILPKEEFHYPVNPLKPGKHYEETMSISKEIGPAVVEAIRSLL